MTTDTNLTDVPDLTDVPEIAAEDTLNFNAILCRTNAGCISAAMAVWQADKSFCLLISGGIQSLKSFVFAAIELKQNNRVDHPELGAFANWDEVLEYVGSDEGAELKLMVKIVDQYGTSALLALAMNSLPEAKKHEADVQVVTCHRAKGSEWDRVLIFPDFPAPKDSPKVPIADVRLAYVAVTRARLYLNCHAIDWLLSGEYEVEGAA